jgi:hypothetical protein
VAQETWLPILRRKLPKEAFLSHSSKDHAFADRLVQVLRNHGIRVWFSPRHLVPAQRWHREIGRALARCDWFIVVLSRKAVKSEWVERELTYALSHRRYRSRILPLLKEPCRFERLSWTLGGLQRVSFQSSFERGCRDLLRVWGVTLKRSPGSRRKRK